MPKRSGRRPENEVPDSFDDPEDVGTRPSRKKKPAPTFTKLRIIGGSMRGRTISFRVDPTTRPMKDRTRESLFNLVGGRLDGFVAIDLFAGSGILGFESISRGAEHAIGIEIDRASHQDIVASAAGLGLTNFEARKGDAFYFSQSIASWMEPWYSKPWCVYMCPPYRLWKEQRENCQQMIDAWCQAAPTGSLIAIEFEEPAPTEMLPENWEWDVRKYLPAMVAIGNRPAIDENSGPSP